MRLRRLKGQSMPHLGDRSTIPPSVAEDRVPAPDTAFDREWAVTLLARALGRLEQVLEGEGKADHFAVLKPWLTTEADEQPQAVAAGHLGLSEAAVKVAIHRLRARFRGVVRAELAATLVMPEQVDEELGHLMAALQ